jgi:FdhD protein
MKEEEPCFDKIKLLKWTEQGYVETTRPVVQEVPLTIYLNDHEVVTLLCLGDHLKRLAIGFLKSEGLIRQRSGIKSVLVDETNRLVRVEVEENTELNEKLFLRRTLTSGCGKGTTFYNALDALTTGKNDSSLRIKAREVFHLMQQLNEQSELYKLTGGTHNSALATAKELIIFRTDIGRHNAVDKIYGECFLEDIPLQNKILLTTGRMTSEILIKTAHMGIPILVSRSTATTLAVSLAREINLTMIGYVRGGNQIVYSGEQRVSASD